MATGLRWGGLNPLPFKITLNGVGQAGLTLQDADIQIMSDMGAWANAEDIGNITDEGNGWYSWTPNGASNTQVISLVFNIKDASAGGEFDENGVVFFTGGNVAAFYDGV